MMGSTVVPKVNISCCVYFFSLQVCHKTFKVIENASNYCTQLISCGLDGLAAISIMYMM